MKSSQSLTNKVKEAGKHALIYGFGSVLQSMIGFVFIPLYTKYYTPEIYGTFSILTICGTLAATLFGLGAPSSLSRSYFDYSAEEERAKVASTSLAIGAAGFCLLLLTGIFASQQLSNSLFSTDQYSIHLLFTMTSSGIGVLNNVLNVLLRFRRRSVAVISIGVSSLLTQSILIFLLLVHFKLGILAPILGGLIGQFLQFTLLTVVAYRYLSPRLLNSELPVQLKFGAQSVLVGLGMYSLDWINRFLMKSYCSLHDVGVYTLAYQIGSIINLGMILPFSFIWAPMRMEYIKDNDSPVLFRLITSYYFFAGYGIILLVSLFSHDLLALIVQRDDFMESYKLIPFVMIALLIYGSINIVDIGVYYARKQAYVILIFFGTAALNALLAKLLFPTWGYLSAGLLLVFSNGLMAFAVACMSNRYHRLSFEWKRLAGQTALLAIALSTLFFELPSGKTGLWVKSTAAFGYFFASYVFILSNKEKQKLYGLKNFFRNADQQTPN